MPSRSEGKRRCTLDGPTSTVRAASHRRRLTLSATNPQRKLVGTMGRAAPSLVIHFSVDSPPGEAFDTVVPLLADGLRRSGIVFETKLGGIVKEREVEIGKVTTWKAGEEVRLEWKPAPWDPSQSCGIRIAFESTPPGTRVRWELEGWEEVLTSSGGNITEWAAAMLLPAAFRQLGPSSLGDWITDSRARRPSGKAARATYRDPIYHWPNFYLILDRIHLTATDRLLEVACGGGAFLAKALESGCSGTAIDHSPEMVEVAKEANRAAIDAGRVEILQADAARLPVADNAYSCCVCTGAFSFFPDPEASLKEMYRALAPSGRLAIFAATAAMRGTPAAPEPLASRIHFYAPEELADLVRSVGFCEVRADEPEMEPYARQARLPEELVAFFRGHEGALLLTARKP